MDFRPVNVSKAYWDGANANRQEASSDLQQAQGLMQILGQLQQQGQRQQAAQKAQAYERAIGSLGPNATEEDYIKAALPHMGADAAGRMLVSSRDKRNQIAATKANAMARLDQDYQKFIATYEQKQEMIDIAERNARSTEEKNALAQQRLLLDRWKATGEMALKKRASDIQAANTEYNTGTAMAPLFMEGAPRLDLSGGAPSQAAPQPLVTKQWTQPTSQQVPPQDREAYEAVLANAKAGIPSSEYGPMPAAPAPAPAQAESDQPFPMAAPYDPRDFRLQGGGAAPAAPAAPAQPPRKVWTPDDAPAGLSPRARQQWALDRQKEENKQSIAGAGTLTPQALEVMADQYLAGDRQVVAGFARSATARIAIQNAIVERAQKRGMSGEQIAAQIADFAGTMAGSRTVGTRAANISLAATEAQEMLGIVKETSDGFARSQFVPWNMALKAYETQTGSPEVVKFGAAVNALVNVYARAIAPSGIPTVHDKEHAREVLNMVQTPQQVDAVLGIMRRELEIAKKAPNQVREATRQRITGESGGGGWSIRPK